jgi:hypothetical protein
VFVQSQPSTAASNSEETPLTQRERTGEDSETGVGRQKRPRDRDVEDASPAPEATVLTSDPVLGVPAAVQGSTQQNGQTLLSLSLTDEEIDQLIFIREEEKLARDVYLALAEKWNAPIFTNIALSEQQHMDAVGQLIERYGLEDPITDDTRGIFTNETLRQLYDGLISTGDVDLTDLEPGLVIQGGGTSLLDAYKVGAFIEEFDIIDIQHAIDQTSHSDVENVYDNLLRGSRNHLRSFVGQIEAAGEDYEPVLMSDSDYLAIINSAQETANGLRFGREGAGTQPTRGNFELSANAADQLFAGIGRRSDRKR